MSVRNRLLTAAWLLALGAAAAAYFSGCPAAVEAPAAAPATVAHDDLPLAQEASGDELERLKAALATLEHRLERTEAALVRVSSTLETLAGRPGGNAQSSGERPPVKRKPLTMAQIEQINHRQREKDAARLNDNFQMQSVDSAWSPQATTLIAESLTNNRELPGVELIASECRESLCRVEVLIDGTEQKLQFEDKLPFLVGEVLPNVMMFDEPQPDGSIRSVIYLGK